MSVLTNHADLPGAASNGYTLPAAAPSGRPSWSGILRLSLVW
jgi:hypothetical protein